MASASTALRNELEHGCSRVRLISKGNVGQPPRKVSEFRAAVRSIPSHAPQHGSGLEQDQVRVSVLRHGANHDRGLDQMSQAIPSGSPDLPKRLSSALNRRVGPGRPISDKQFAYEMRGSLQTVWTWKSGNTMARGDHLMRMFAFFDASFANEVAGEHGLIIAKLSDARAASAVSQINKLAPVIAALTELSKSYDEDVA